MKKLISKHYLKSFYVITLLFSIPLLALHFVFQDLGKYSVSLTQLAPALAVVAISIALRDRKIISDIGKKFFLDKTTLKWLIPVVLIPALCIVVSGLIMSYFSIDYVPWRLDVISFVSILIGCITEEIGWRGFLLPNLQKKNSPFISSLIVGALWGVWHLNFTGGILGFALYTVTIIEMSILMTWVYNMTGGNLILMTIWHLVFNLASRIFLWERFLLSLFVVESLVFGVLCLFVLRRTFFSERE